MADLSATPTARQIVDDSTDGAQAPMRQSRLGLVALVIAGVSLVMMITFTTIARAHIDQFTEIQNKQMKLIEQGSDIFTASQASMADLMKSGPGGTIPTWFVMTMLLTMCSGLAWLVAITCALIALRNPTSRKQAYMAIGLCSVTLITFCMSG